MVAAFPALAEDRFSAPGTFDIPASAHFSHDRLKKIGEFFEKQIADNKIPGAIVLIQQHGKPVYKQFFGVRDPDTGQPMTDDTIFRLHSMTKPITSFAAMMLVDEGRLKLDDPVSKYIPSFGSVKVGVEKKLENGEKALEIVAPERPVNIRDLLLHTSGITYGFYGDSMVRRAYGNAQIYNGNFDNKDFADRIAQLPLEYQPGKIWDYGHSTDILGRVIEVISGKSLLAFEQEKFLGPLGMKDTGFFVKEKEKEIMLAKPIGWDRDFRTGRQNRPETYQKWESGSGGMVSTMSDYAKFAQMLLNGGELDGKRYMSPATFKDMTTDKIGKESGIARDAMYFPGDGFGFGYGFAVRTDAGNAKPPPPGSLGELKWDGASGCYFIIDPKHDFFVVLLEQTPSERQRIQRSLKLLVYEALQH
ncbi:beta-lactamase family protein [Tardiphaga sp. vice352]|nr:beta-lactamase family protein [Tardiphaga sp.]QDM19440.1 beta-lactamase family protein [Tardiphaga sp. vice278]QDM24417.1 beta-lactamase family protein [Tardiphaga sp. vice154]QDM29627.1 beta-lactamase family protein [Tardiphaga sp. vice304]QDM34724.1 beta-lactamase family protein [Tardiphaga sp. vice352]